MATSLATSAAYNQEEINYTRMQMIIQKDCHKVLKAYMLKKLNVLHPGMNIDTFLNMNKSGFDFRREGKRYKKRYFPLDANNKPIHTNLNNWDIHMLSFTLTTFFNLSKAEIDDINFIREKRNYISHLGIPEVAENEYTAFKSDLNAILTRLFSFLHDTQLEEEINRDFDVNTNRLTEKMVEYYKAMHRENSSFEDLRAEHSEHRSVTDANTVMITTLLREMQEMSKRLPDDAKKKLAPPECSAGTLRMENCRNEQEENKVDEQIQQSFLKKGLKKIQSLIKKIADIFQSLYGWITSAEQGCVEISIKFYTFETCLNYIEDVIAGKLEPIFEPLQDALRQEFDNDELELKFIMTEDQFIECINTVGLGIKNALAESFPLEENLYTRTSELMAERIDSRVETKLSLPSPDEGAINKQKPGGLGLKNALAESFPLKKNAFTSWHMEERTDSPVETKLSLPNPADYVFNKPKSGACVLDRQDKKCKERRDQEYIKNPLTKSFSDLVVGVAGYLTEPFFAWVAEEVTSITPNVYNK